MSRPTIHSEIRRIVDAADRRLANREIYAQMRVPVSTEVFTVELAKMLKARQVDRRKATNRVRARFPGVRSVYGPGPMPVESGNGSPKPKKIVGFMAMKRAREARREGRRA